MTAFVDQAITDRALGLALHYPLLHAAVVGLAARRTFEFGAGGSTRVLLDAIATTGGEHHSISTAPQEEIAARYAIRPPARWAHTHGRSEDHRGLDVGLLDLVLHDGSHSADVVAGDIAWIWPRLRPFGLLLVHDTQHGYVGPQMREGLRRGLDAAGARCTCTTLSYGFGLTIVRREEGGPGMVEPAVAKVISSHQTVLAEFRP